MVNSQLLDETIKEKGVRTDFLIRKIGISKNGYYKKKNNQIPFKTAEIFVITNILGLSEEEEQGIFFAN